MVHMTHLGKKEFDKSIWSAGVVWGQPWEVQRIERVQEVDRLEGGWRQGSLQSVVYRERRPWSYPWKTTSLSNERISSWAWAALQPKKKTGHRQACR